MYLCVMLCMNSLSHAFVSNTLTIDILLLISTGASILLPTPIFTRLFVGDDGDNEEGDENEDGENDEGETTAEAGDDEEKQQPKKKVKTSASSSSSAPSTATGKGQRSHEGPKPIRTFAFHTNNEWFMYASEDKYLHLYHIASSSSSSSSASAGSSAFRYVLTIPIARKVQTAIFHPSRFSSSSSDSTIQLPNIFVADKTGDIYLISGQDLLQQKLELGHLANITQLEFLSHTQTDNKKKNYLLTSDSDGKIRVSNVPNLFDIQSFCLGHQAFVSSFSAISSAAGPIIVSGGLGAEVIVWRLQDGVQLAKIELKQDGTAAALSTSNIVSSSSPTVAECYVSQVTCLPSTTNGVSEVFVSIYPWSCAFLLNVTSSSITLKSSIKLPSLLNASSIHDDQLLLIDESLRVRAWSLSKQVEVNTSADSPLHTALVNLNTPLINAQSTASTLLITPTNASVFVGSGSNSKSTAPNESQQGRYISPFSSLHTDTLTKLSLLSPAGFTYRRYADKVQREAFIQIKKAEAATKRVEAKENKKLRKAENKRQKQTERTEMEE